MSRKSELNKLKKEWYAKLKASGFDDLEYRDGSIRSGRPRSPSFNNPVAREATIDYYYMAHHFLSDYKFKNKTEKAIWELHTTGNSVRTISKLLATEQKVLPKTLVWTIIKRLKVIMKDKYKNSYE